MKKIGLLGGSFNPAHIGHVEISRQAHSLLGLDEVWWVVTPQNPLKDVGELGAVDDRVNYALGIEKPDFISVKLIENVGEKNYSYDLVLGLISEYDDTKFIWLMGEDNLYGFDKWYRWEDFCNMINIAVFPRESEYFFNSFMEKYKSYRLRSDEAALLLEKSPPYWCLLDTEKINISATEIRNGRNI